MTDKFCVNCKHYEHNLGKWFDDEHQCTVNFFAETGRCPVTGEMFVRYRGTKGSCRNMRFEDGKCGENGRLFKPKE